MEVPRIPLKTGGYSVPTLEEMDQRPAVATEEESVGAAFDLAMEDTAVMAGAKLWAFKDLDAQTGKRLSPEEANEMFPGMPTPFREPVNPYVAQLQFDLHSERSQLESKVHNGPQDASASVKQFGVGMVAHLLDPVEFGAGAVSGWGIGAIAARSALVGSLATRAGTSALARTGLNAGEALAGNVIENVASEGIVAAAQTREGREYDPVQGFVNVAVGSLVGSGVGVGIKEASFRIGGKTGWEDAGLRYKMLEDSSPEAHVKIIETGLANLENDIKPRMGEIMEEVARETDVNPKDFGLPEYSYRELTPDEVKTTKLFAATRDATPILKDGQHAPVGDDFGMGLTVTDNPGVANAAASRSLSENVGAVHEIQITGEIRPIQFEAPVPDHLEAPLNEILSRIDSELDRGMTLKDAATIIRQAVREGELGEDALDQLKQVLIDNGYNTIQSNGSSRLGIAHGKHNQLTFLDDSMYASRGAMEPERSDRKSVV